MCTRTQLTWFGMTLHRAPSHTMLDPDWKGEFPGGMVKCEVWTFHAEGDPASVAYVTFDDKRWEARDSDPQVALDIATREASGWARPFLTNLMTLAGVAAAGGVL